MEPTARGSVLRHPDFKMFSEHKFITIIFLLYGKHSDNPHYLGIEL